MILLKQSRAIIFPGLGGPSQGCNSRYSEDTARSFTPQSNQSGRAEMRDQGDRQVLGKIIFNGKCAGRTKVG